MNSSLLPRSWRTDDGHVGELSRDLMRALGVGGSLLRYDGAWFVVRFTDGLPASLPHPKPWARPLVLYSDPCATVGRARWYLGRIPSGRAKPLGSPVCDPRGEWTSIRRC